MPAWQFSFPLKRSLALNKTTTYMCTWSPGVGSVVKRMWPVQDTHGFSILNLHFLTLQTTVAYLKPRGYNTHLSPCSFCGWHIWASCSEFSAQDLIRNIIVSSSILDSTREGFVSKFFLVIGKVHFFVVVQCKVAHFFKSNGKEKVSIFPADLHTFFKKTHLIRLGLPRITTLWST